MPQVCHRDSLPPAETKGARAQTAPSRQFSVSKPPTAAVVTSVSNGEVNKTLSQQQLTAVNDMSYLPSYRDITVSTPKDSRVLKDKEGFTLVTKKKPIYRYKNLRGTLQNATKLQAAETYAYIYLSRAKKQIQENDIKEYIQQMNEQCYAVEMLKQNRETNFNSFKITILATKLNIFLKNDFWPENLVFRKYRQQRSPRNDTVVPNN